MSNYSVRVKAVLDTSGIRAQLQSMGKNNKIRFDTTGVAKAQKEVGGLGRTAQETYNQVGKAGKSVGGGFKGIIPSIRDGTKGFGEITKKVLQFGASTAIIRGAGSAVGSVVKNVYDLDSSLTEFKKVSDLSGKGLEKYTDQAYKTGEAVARTGTEIIDAATNFKKSGYSEADSMVLAEVASKFQNIADTELSASDASAFLISQMKAFNLTANDTNHIIDATNEV